MNPYEEKQEAQRQREAREPPIEPKQSTDPVCGMRVEPAEGMQASFRGETYDFCSDECREKFEANPGRYVAAH
jgi:YHS domain-containing protein